jgi:hypothetical protein
MTSQDRDEGKNHNVDKILAEIKSEEESGARADYRGGQGGLGGPGGPGTPGGAGGVGGMGGEGGRGGTGEIHGPGGPGKGKANAPKQGRVFEKQFLILIVVMIVGTAVFAFNPYLILQGQEEIHKLSEQGAEQRDTIINNQGLQTRILKTILDQNQEQQEAQEEARRQLGDQWLKFMNAMLVDIEQSQDEAYTQLGVNVTDRIQNNGTHIIFNNDTIEIIKGIPKINLSSISNNTATDT